MKEKPILFSGPMVRAILDGRKTQTRRIVKPQPPDGASVGWSVFSRAYGPDCVEVRRYAHQGGDHQSFISCPYGQPGDRLWVKETHRFDGIDQRIGVQEKRIDALSYRADMEGDQSCDDCAWRPSIFMPRWASRITLEVTGVRVERLQDISADDCVVEGAGSPVGTELTHGRVTTEWNRRAYRALWESINGSGSWDANPWVWVVEFKRIAP